MQNADKKYSLILASGSPRRKELLGHLGIPFDVIVADIDETLEVSDPEKYCQHLASEKGKAVLERLKKNADFYPLIVSADTIVCLNQKIYNKPSDINEARTMLRELSGKTHQVYTGVAITRLDISNKSIIQTQFFDRTEVTFDVIREDILEHYLSTKDSLDKAGAYGIQGGSLSFISHLVGSYSNVVGFPLSLFVQKLNLALGLKAQDPVKNAFLS